MKWINILVVAVLMFGIWTSIDGKYETKEYVVKQGDTIWSVVTSETDAYGDVRELVYQTYKINNIAQSEDIYPGQVILIPIRK